MSEIATRASLPIRVLRALRVVTYAPPEQEAQFNAGSDFAAAVSVPTKYDPNRARSALLANPWYFRACRLKAEKAAALPLEVQAQDAEGQWVAVPDHPLRLRLASPNSGQTELQWRQQLVTDYLPGGDAFILGGPSDSTGAPAYLKLLEPARVDITPGRDGSPLAYDYDEGGAERCYPPDAIAHLRAASAGGDLERLFGTGEVQPMDRDIDADVKLAAQMARKSGKGRPDAAYVPSKPDTVWGRPQVRDMQTQIDRVLTEQTGGVAVMSGAGKFELLDWTVGDLGGIDARKFTRETVAAVTGVPPTMLGSQAANYATAEMERINFIEDTLRPLVRLIDDCLTDYARRLGFVGVRVRHIVPEMQDSRTERLKRVEQHIAHGMAPADAYAFEGFDDAPELASFGIPAGDAPADADADAPPPPAPGMSDDDRDDIRAQAQAIAAILADMDDDEDPATVDDLVTELAALLDLLAPILSEGE